MILIPLRPHDREVYDRAVARERASIEADAQTHGGKVGRFLRITAHRFLDHDATVESLQREAQIDRNALHPTFHRLLGITPWRYICARRFDVAKCMLARTRVEVWKVGCLVGYQDPRTFLRAFKRVVGRTPSKEAKRLRKEAAGP